MNTIKFITPAQVRSMCPQINQEIEDGLINDSITLMQEAVIKPTFGYDFYNELILQKSGGTYSTANKTLMDSYISWILSFAVWQNLVVSTSYQLNSSGLRLKTSDHSVLAESVDIQYCRSYTQNFIDSTRRSMFDYMEDNKTSYPTYFNNRVGGRNMTYDWKIGSVGGIGTRTRSIPTYYNSHENN